MKQMEKYFRGFFCSTYSRAFMKMNIASWFRNALNISPTPSKVKNNMSAKGILSTCHLLRNLMKSIVSIVVTTNTRKEYSLEKRLQKHIRAVKPGSCITAVLFSFVILNTSSQAAFLKLSE
jgi:hypothetical protein